MNPSVATIDMTDLSVTPVFKIIEVENIPKSETAGRAVMETQEVVEVRLAGNKNFSPIFPTGAFWKREGNRVITYAERWPEQYRAFKEGNAQEAMGTPLEMLREHGVTPEMISLCRALKIYSIESLAALEGAGLRALGMNGNRLKDAARAWEADRMSTRTAMGRIEELEAQIAALRQAGASVPPVQETEPEVIEQMVAQADAAFAGMSDEQIKEEIAALTGSRPRGNPSRATLEQALTELRAA